MTCILRALLAALLLVLPTAAFGQGAVLQSGPRMPGHVPQYVGSGPQTIVMDGGPAGGGVPGVNPAEFALTARGTGTPPYVAQGTGPLGTNWCNYDAPTNNPTGYHYLCLGPNPGQLVYGAGGIATPLPFSFNINGNIYTFPAAGTTGNVVTTVVPTTSGAPVCFIGNSGQVTPCPPVPAATFTGNPTAGPISQAVNFTVQGLPARGAPDANNDKLVVLNSATGALNYVTPGLIAASATSGVSSLGGITGPVTLGSDLQMVGSVLSFAPMQAQTVKCNPTGSSAVPQNCTNPVVTGLTATASVLANTSLISPVLAGGGAAGSLLQIMSTFGSGTSDYIQFLTGSQVERGRIFSNGSFLWTTGTASQAVTPYGGSPTGVGAWSITNSDSSALTGTERYTGWVSNTSAGTGDGSIGGTTYALGVSNVKQNWQTTGVQGQTIGLLVTARGGYNNAQNFGDTAAINVNAVSSYTNNLAQQFEGVSGYFPAGSTTGSLFINTQIGSVRAVGLDTGGNTGIGFFAQARNGLVGNAFSANNLCASPTYGTCSKWANFLSYTYDDGTHSPYVAFSVNQTGQLTLAGVGTAGTNQKTIRVGGSNVNNLEILNAANSTVIWSLGDTGTMTFGAGAFVPNGGAATPAFGANTLPSTVSVNSVAKWLWIIDPSGNNLYIPAWH